MRNFFTKKIIFFMAISCILGFYLGYLIEIRDGTVEILIPNFEECEEYDCILGVMTDVEHELKSEEVMNDTTLWFPVQMDMSMQYPLMENTHFQFLTIYGVKFGNTGKSQFTQLTWRKLIININDLSVKKLCAKYKNCTSPYFMIGSKTQSLSDELWKRAEGDSEKYVDEVYDYVNGLEYDFDKVNHWTESELFKYERSRMNTDVLIENQSGICWEKANCMAAMLRYQGIPCKVCVGQYVEGHAWNEIYLNDSWIFCDATCGKFRETGSFKDYTLHWSY